MKVSIYGFSEPQVDIYAFERENRYFEYLKEKINVEIRLNPNPTDEGYNLLLIEVAKSCCRQEQRMWLIERLGFNKEQNDDE